MSERTGGGVAGWIVGIVCIAAVVAIAVGWSAIRRAERAEQRITVLEGVIEQKNGQIVELQKGVEAESEGESGGSAEVGQAGE